MKCQESDQISPFGPGTQNCEDRETEVKIGKEGKENTVETKIKKPEVR
jgi:hypothetical protein